MTQLRAKSILNAAKAKFDCEYLQGPFNSDGYFYVVYDSLDNEKGDAKKYETRSAYIMTLNELNLDQWMSYFQDVIDMAKGD